MDRVAMVIVFLSAFLLFLVQPIISKYLLPYFGGGFSIWIVSMLCFQLLLLAGYGYADIVTRKPFKYQLVIHLLIIFLVLMLQIIISRSWNNPILPLIKPDWSPFLPEVSLAGFVLVGVGLPYFLLSTTSSLLQFWYAQKTGRSPYFLYRYSNLASLTAIVIYPFLIEPGVGLSDQGQLWFIGFFVYILALILFSLLIFRFNNRLKIVKAVSLSVLPKQFFIPSALKTPMVIGTENATVASRCPSESRAEQTVNPDVRRGTKGFIPRRFIWVGLSALPTIAFMAFTNMLTQGISPVPFLWLIPLGIYLLSYVLAFSGRIFIPLKGKAIGLVLMTFLIAMLSVNVFNFIPLPYQVIILSAHLFYICLAFFEVLYIGRPESGQLTRYYLAIAIGGVVGGLFVGVVAPIIFPTFIEMPLILIVTLIFIAKQISTRLTGRFKMVFIKYNLLSALLFTSLVFGIAGLNMTFNNLIFIDRNFYGLVRVKSERGINYLYSGVTLHGLQYQDKVKSFIPTSYYGYQTGVGWLYQNLLKQNDSLNVGLVGLGTGTLAAYCRPIDTYRFYEINPNMVKIAQQYFTYLSICPQKTIILGDARLSLTDEVKRSNLAKFDLLILDAFSDDSIPAHLLTKEAFDIFLHRIYKNGVIAVHISSRYVDLTKPLGKVADFYHLDSLALTYQKKLDEENYPSIWVIMGNPLIVNQLREEAKDKPNLSLSDLPNTGQLWTDDYSNLFNTLKL